MFVLVFLGLAAACASSAFGQADKKSKIPEPEDLTLETKDGVQLRCTFYPGTAKKASVPVIMIHGWEGQRSEFHSLALGLQSQGHTVIVPDLRGHGESTIAKLPGGENADIKLDKFRTPEVKAMILDLDACKKHLIEQNNAGECNIEMLCLVGSEFGSILALNYAAYDWNRQVLPAFKLGQDVRALVLLTPMQSHKGLTIREAMGHPAVRAKLAVMLVAGKDDSKGAAEAKRMFNSFQTYHPKVEDDADEQRLKQDLFLVTPDTSLSGTELLGVGLNLPANVARFIELRLVAKQDELVWGERRDPRGGN